MVNDDFTEILKNDQQSSLKNHLDNDPSTLPNIIQYTFSSTSNSLHDIYVKQL